MNESDGAGRDERWELADRIFQAALDLEGEERATFLERECGGDAELRLRVERLLAHAEEDSWLAPGGGVPDAAAGLDTESPFAPSFAELPLPRDLTEKYRLLRKIGEGGMGEVYEAVQKSPVQRRVAIKVIKEGMHSKQVVARFESERQALALMDHPNIARVFDAGISADGRPFFVMERVHGIPITEHCDKHRLGLEERLRLFLPVCAGVQHAHRRAIIHRDLKPTNILVAMQDGHPVPKIIDFGVAKATAQPLTHHTLFTAMGQVIGTPAYMSPEQAEMSGQNVDTRTDVYALGVVLYQLLVGALPLDPTEMMNSGLEEIVRRIREVDPPRPSTRLRDMEEGADRVAANRRLEPTRLRGRVRGDLDWIVMKALEKDRARRYESPADLAADIERHLRDEPVSAGPPGAGYRIGKFVRRHTLAVSAAVSLLIVLIGFAAMMAVQASRIAAERDRANQEAAAAGQVSDFMVHLFQLSDPIKTSGATITARELLEEGASRVDTELADQPLVQARLMQTMGEAYQGLGLYDAARPLLEKTVEIRRRELAADDPQLAGALASLSNITRLMGDYDRGLALAEEVLAIREAHPETPAKVLAEAHSYLGVLHWYRGEYAPARESLEEALAIYQKHLDPDDPGLPRILSNIAILSWQLGDYGPARRYCERALAIWERQLGPEHPDVASVLLNLGMIVDETDHAEARGIYQRCLAIREKTLGPDHPDIGEVLSNLGNSLRYLGELDKAREVLERALPIREKAFGPDHPELAFTLINLGAVSFDQKRYGEARAELERSRVIMEKALGPDHVNTSFAYLWLGEVMSRQGEMDEARKMYERALAAKLG